MREPAQDFMDWRAERALELGLTQAMADLVAREMVDLDELASLISKGATPLQAARILL